MAASEAVMKKPMTPCFAYINDSRASIRVRANMQGKGLWAVSVKGSDLFKALPEAEKKKYQDRYEQEKKTYEEWAQTEVGKAALAAKKGDARDKKASKQGKVDKKEAKPALKNAKAEAGCPKKPMTPCLAYIQDHRKEIGECDDVKGKGLGARSKKGAELFKALSASERAVYEVRYEEEKKAYDEWFKSDAGAAFTAKQNESRAEAKAAAKESKAAAKEAKAQARATAKESKGAAKEEAKAAAKESKTAAKEAKAQAKENDRTKANRAGAKRGRGKSATAEPPAKLGRGRGRRSSASSVATPEPLIDAAVLAEATKKGFERQLENLAARPEVAASGKSASEIMKALTKSDGIVNAAKRAMLGA